MFDEFEYLCRLMFVEFEYLCRLMFVQSIRLSKIYRWLFVLLIFPVNCVAIDLLDL